MAIVLSIFQLHSPIYPHVFTDLGEDYDDYDGLVKKGATQEQLADARLRGVIPKEPPRGKVDIWKDDDFRDVLNSLNGTQAWMADTSISEYK